MHRLAGILVITALSGPALSGQARPMPPRPIHAIVPVPAMFVAGTGTFTFGPSTLIVVDAGLEDVGRQLAGMLAPAMGRTLDVRPGTAAGAHVELRLSRARASSLGDEGYALESSPDAVRIVAAAPAGVFYGIQSLRQLLPPAIFSRTTVTDTAWTVPAVRIEDVPRFSWRGSHLDVSRHFMPLDYVRKHLDLMAMHKLNRFHWHLTDDQGWRVEIRKYPRLTEVAGWRKETIIGHERTGPDVTFDGTRHGGFYTQDEIRDIVAYATERFITVVPEIEMPGHSQAIISAYPELGSVEEPVEPRTRWGVSDYILNPEPHTIAFMQDVLTEVLDLFPGPWIHIGGDEATKTQWEQNPRIQARMRQLGVADEHELQSWFIRQMDTFLTARGRRLIGWDEILEGGLAPNATVMAWRGIGAAVDSARAGHDAVLTPTSHTYLDYYQSADTDAEPLAIGGFLPLDRVYTWEPMPPGLEPEHRHRILGVQAQLWTEYMPNPRQVEYMAFPRLSALAEVAWSPADARDLEGFRVRLGPHLERLRRLDVNFRPTDLARPAYKDPTQPTEARVADLISRMTRTEKFWQLFMLPGDLDDPAHDYSNGVFGLQIRRRAETAAAHAERVNAIQRHFVANTRLGIPIIPFEETLHGVHMPAATMFPQAIGLAATFDTDLMSRVATAIAREARTRGIRQALSPVVNMADDVRWGRVEETYGEDPYLSSEMARAFVTAFEQAGVVATPKHFVANVGEGGRDSYPIQHSERLLAERHYPPFETAIREAGARSVMSAYNSVDGLPATQNPALLTGVLRRAWNFRGFVISDAAATGGSTVLHHTNANTAEATADAIRAGLDVIFQTSWEQHRAYQQAFSRGLISDELIDSAVARVLRVKFDLGLFEDPYVDPDVARTTNGHPDHRALARLAAEKSLVLLRNEGSTLPIARSARRVAVIGADASEARLGGYSGPGIDPVSILDAMRSRTAVAHAPGVPRALGAAARGLSTIPAGAFATAGTPAAEGLTAEYFANIRLEGEPALRRVDPGVNARWTLNSPGRGLPFDWYSVRWRGELVVPPGGVRRLAVEGNDGYRLWVGDRLVADHWRKQSFGLREIALELPAGSRQAIRLEFFESTGNARLRLLWDAGPADETDARIAEAVAAARAADAAVIVAGVEEGEFRDRAFLHLPGRQEELILAVAGTGTPTTVVLIGGSAVTMSRWIERVGAVVQAWYPGEVGGTAVANVLFGDVNPAGRLPITFPMAEGQLPLSYNHKPTGRGDDYVDLSGMPLFPFGHGLSYTTFEYTDLQVTPAATTADGIVTVTCTVRNTGSRAGEEVVQVYLRDVLGSVARPVMELRRFARIALAPDEARTLTFTLERRDLEMLNAAMARVVEPGVFRVLVGASSEDVRLRGEFTVK